MTKVKFADDDRIKKMKKELKEFNHVLKQSSPIFVSDQSRYWYHGQSSQSSIDYSAFNFYYARLTIAYGIDFSPILKYKQNPLLLDLLQFIKENRKSPQINSIPSNLKNWGGIIRISDELTNDEDLKDLSISMIIFPKEEYDYQKGYSLIDDSFAKTNWMDKHMHLLNPGKFVISFEDGTKKFFKTKEDIYYFLIASSSNNPNFRYDSSKILN